MVRAIPGDVFGTAEGRLQVVYYDVGTAESREELFDMLVLSVGMTPAAQSCDLGAMFGLAVEESGFIASTSNGSGASSSGVFTAGAVTGPKSIAESIASAHKAALEAAAFLGDEVIRQQ